MRISSTKGSIRWRTVRLRSFVLCWSRFGINFPFWDIVVLGIEPKNWKLGIRVRVRVGWEEEEDDERRRESAMENEMQVNRVWVYQTQLLHQEIDFWNYYNILPTNLFITPSLSSLCNFLRFYLSNPKTNVFLN